MTGIELTPEQAAELRAAGLPPGTEIVVVEDIPYAGHSFRQAPSGLYVPSRDVVAEVIAEAQRPPPVAVELFTGAGGFSLGIHQAGFDVIAGVEWDEAAAYTYLSNLGHPDCVVHVDEAQRKKWERLTGKGGTEWGRHYAKSEGWQGQKGARVFFVGDVRNITGDQIRAATGVEHVDLVFGGPPCQGLSTANPQAALEDPRNGLLWEFLRIVEELRPSAFMIENVPPLFTAGKGALIEALASKAVNAGYEVRASVLDAVDYGVPQFRRRAFVVGTKNGAYRFPMPTNWSKGWSRDGRRWWQPENGEHDRLEEERIEAVYDQESGAWSLEVEQPAAPSLGPLFEAAP